MNNTRQKNHLNTPKNMARLAMLVGGILMGFVGLFVKALEIIPTFSIVSLRGFFASLILLSLLLSIRGGPAFRLLWKYVRGLLITQGLFSVSTVLLYFYTIQASTYGYAAFMLYTGPIFAVFFMWWFLHKIPQKRDLGAFLIALIGISILTRPWDLDFNFLSQNNTFAFITGLLSGISLGLLSTCKVMIFERLKKITPTLPDSEQQIIATQSWILNINMAFVSTALLFIVFVIPSYSTYIQLEPIHWIIAFFLGLIPTAIAFTLVNIGLQYDEAGDVLIFSYSETLVGAALTAFIDSDLSIGFFLGGFLIILSNLIIALKSKKG